MTTTVVAGVDSSTQSCKVELRAVDDGTLVGSGSAPHPMVHPPRSEQDPELWWQALVAAMGQARRAAGDPAVVAISVAGQQHGLVALDASGRVLRPAKLWNDTESAPDAVALTTHLGPQGWARASGSVPTASFTVTKLAWLARCEPHHLRALATVLLPHDWLTTRLCGRAVTDRGDASGTGYYDPAADRWRPDLLALVDPELGDQGWLARLPAVLGPTETAGTCTAEAAALGLTPATVVAAGTGDNMAAALSCALAPGDVALSLGTSGTVCSVADRPTHDPTGAVAGFADATGCYLPLVCTLNATRVTDTVATWLGLDHHQFAADALSAAPGAGGVVLVPYFDGERTPNLPDASGTFAGLRTTTTRQQLARAAVEGVVCSLLDGLDALAAAGTPVETGALVLVGGGARSPAYRQVLADLAQRPVRVVPDAEHVARGACVQAAATLRAEALEEVARRWGLGEGTTVEADPEVDAVAVRAAYRATRSVRHPEG